MAPTSARARAKIKDRGRVGAAGPVASILQHEQRLDASFLPSRLVRREKELGALFQRYRGSLGDGVPYHQLITGGIGSGKTAIARRLGEDLQKAGKFGALGVQPVYINCWRRSNDRTLLLELLRAVNVYLPDRGYALGEMVDVFEQGIRKAPRHLFVILDEVSALVRQETKLVYLLTRSREVGLGSISLFLVAPEDVLPYLDAASRSSFGVTHRLQLSPYTAEDLAEILKSRADGALRPGSCPDEVFQQIAHVAAAKGDARFAIELLVGAARAAEGEDSKEITPEHVRAASGSIYPTVTEEKIAGLPSTSLLVLLALARSLKPPKWTAPTERVRQAYGVAAEERGQAPVSRVQFWRTVKQLEREGLVEVQAASPGESALLSMNEVPTSFLETLVDAQPASRPRKA